LLLVCRIRVSHGGSLDWIGFDFDLLRGSWSRFDFDLLCGSWGGFALALKLLFKTF
jgi:hypothetical protein